MVGVSIFAPASVSSRLGDGRPQGDLGERPGTSRSTLGGVSALLGANGTKRLDGVNVCEEDTESGFFRNSLSALL